MVISQICSKHVVTVEKEQTLVEAARRMRESHVRDLVVVEAKEDKVTPVGMLTDRDIVIAVVADNIDRFNSILVGDVMSFELVTAREDESLTDVLERMGTSGIRHIPVVGFSGELTGLLSFDDVICLLASLMRDLAALTCSEREREREERS
ncbi:MAG: CBS domain-containing protein [Desulforhabdus sp.]|jgi:CBS domain-containing protein|nr:CBS domain-containing protein [Desulforhabdus sp.]